MAFRTRDSCIALLRNHSGFSKVVELYKGLVVLPCLASSVEVYGIHDPVADGYHSLWVKMCNLYRV
jgi:hypothetical protein